MINFTPGPKRGRNVLKIERATVGLLTVLRFAGYAGIQEERLGERQDSRPEAQNPFYGRKAMDVGPAERFLLTG